MEYKEKIGEILLRHEEILPHQVENILLRQECGDRRRFGEIAVDLRYIQGTTLTTYLQTSDLPLWKKRNPLAAPPIEDGGRYGRSNGLSGALLR